MRACYATGRSAEEQQQVGRTRKTRVGEDGWDQTLQTQEASGVGAAVMETVKPVVGNKRTEKA